MLRIPVIKSDIEIPDWAKSIAQDKDGEIRVFKQSVDELNPFYAEWGAGYHSSRTVVLDDYTILFPTPELTIIDWEERKYNLDGSNFIIMNGVLYKL